MGYFLIYKLFPATTTSTTAVLLLGVSLFPTLNKLDVIYIKLNWYFLFTKNYYISQSLAVLESKKIASAHKFHFYGLCENRFYKCHVSKLFLLQSSGQAFPHGSSSSSKNAEQRREIFIAFDRTFHPITKWEIMQSHKNISARGSLHEMLQQKNNSYMFFLFEIN